METRGAPNGVVEDSVWAVEVAGHQAAGGAQAVVAEASGVKEEGGSERRA